MEKITQLANDETKTKEEKVKILRKRRAQLLNEIHVQQQLLDRLDFILQEIKKE